MKNNLPLINAVLIGTIVASIFVLLVTVIGELYPPLKKLLTEVHSHHWIGKGIWTTILFVAAALVSYPFCKRHSIESSRILMLVTTYTLVAVSLLLIAFFIYEFAIRH